MPKKTTSPQDMTESPCCTGKAAGTRYVRLALAVAITVFAVEFIATHIPGEKLPEMHCSDKTLHFFAYAALGIVFTLWLLARGTRARNIIFTGVIFFPLYAAFDEITQPLVNRSADFYDWRMDMIGSIGAMLVIVAAVAIFRKIRK